MYNLRKMVKANKVGNEVSSFGVPCVAAACDGVTEIAMSNADEVTWPTATWRVCFFGHKQCLWRNVVYTVP